MSDQKSHKTSSVKMLIKLTLTLMFLGKKKCLIFPVIISRNSNSDLQKLIPEFWSVNVYCGSLQSLLDKTDQGLKSSL